VSLWPTVEEEREMALREQFGSRVALPLPEGRWSSSSSIAAAVFFVLTCLAIGAFFGLLALFHMAKGFVTAVFCIALAEYLIRKRRMFGTGIESALWLGGLFAFIFGLPSEGKVEALLVFAAASAIAGFRMRNAFFGALAAILIVGYLAVKFERWELTGRHAFFVIAVIVALVVAVASALALLRTWQRPSTEALFASLAVSMLLTAFIVGKFESWSLHFDIRIALTFLVLAAIFLVAGVWFRHHVLLLCAAIATACATFDLQDLVDWNWEWKVIAAGVVMFVVGAGLGRFLRERTTGLVVTGADSSLMGLAQAAATFVVSHPVEPAPAESGFAGGGGSFGGGGASGGYE
jgi:hypothetical protein